MMKLQENCFFSKIPWIIIVLISMLLFSCAELDGVFPKFEPQKKVEETSSLPTSKSVNQKQTILSKENRNLQKKIDKLQQQVFDLQKKQKEQRDDLLILQEQWEVNFILLERSVEESLNYKKVSVFGEQKDPDFQEEQSNQKMNKKNKFKKKILCYRLKVFLY